MAFFHLGRARGLLEGVDRTGGRKWAALFHMASVACDCTGRCYGGHCPMSALCRDSRGTAHHEKARQNAKRRSRPTLVNETVPPRRAFNRDVRPREYLTQKEVERLIAAAKKRGRRYNLRDATMILVAFRH